MHNESDNIYAVVKAAHLSSTHFINILKRNGEKYFIFVMEKASKQRPQ